jgi:hypothetical protein
MGHMWPWVRPDRLQPPQSSGRIEEVRFFVGAAKRNGSALRRPSTLYQPERLFVGCVTSMTRQTSATVLPLAIDYSAVLSLRMIGSALCLVLHGGGH